MTINWQGRRLLIASQHRKESVMEPLITSAWGVVCEVAHDVDTDRFGTFTGEVERAAPAPEMVLIKCRTTMDQYGADLAVASEGSFGPHPDFPFLPADEEFVALIDRTCGLELVAHELSYETNFGGAEVPNLPALIEFAHHALFPSHGLILKDKQENFSTVVKGITDHESLVKAFHEIMSTKGSVYVETDMRAHMNPTRMKVIEAAVERLISKVAARCPSCQWPGFDVVNVERGLTCNACGEPTRGIVSLTRGCSKCGWQIVERFPGGIRTADPSTCDSCNP